MLRSAWLTFEISRDTTVLDISYYTQTLATLKQGRCRILVPCTRLLNGFENTGLGCTNCSRLYKLLGVKLDTKHTLGQALV